MAVQLVQRLLSPSGGIVLEVCRGLWMLQALKELTSREDIQALDKSLLVQHERLEGELDARLSVTAAGSAVANAVAQMNERERHNFQLQAAQQRQQVLTQSTWDLRQLLCWQQQALAKLQVPGFEEGPTSIDEESLQLQSQICQYLHSAFYIRNRMGSEPHETMLKSQLKKLLRDQQEGGVGSSRNSPKMSRLSPIPPPPSFNNSNMSNMMMPMPMQQLPPQYNAYPPQQQQQQLMQPQLQPMLMGMPPQQYNAYHAQQQHQQGMMMYGQQQPPPMMMMHQQQLQQQQPYIMQQQQQQHLQLPPLPPNQPQPPPYGGPPQYPYYQQ